MMTCLIHTDFHPGSRSLADHTDCVRQRTRGTLKLGGYVETSTQPHSKGRWPTKLSKLADVSDEVTHV